MLSNTSQSNTSGYRRFLLTIFSTASLPRYFAIKKQSAAPAIAEVQKVPLRQSIQRLLRLKELSKTEEWVLKQLLIPLKQNLLWLQFYRNFLKFYNFFYTKRTYYSYTFVYPSVYARDKSRLKGI